MNLDSMTEIGPEVQEASEPVGNLMSVFEKIYYAGGMITSPSRFARATAQPEGKERPLFLRAKRAQLYKNFTALSTKEERQNIIKEAHQRDDIAKQSLNQRELKVTLPDWGEQRARVVTIMPPESSRTEATFTKPPILLIPGISNDIDCVAGMMHEIAMLGRRVIVIGYPESYKGQTTTAFAEAVGRNASYTPHVAFFKAALQHFFKENENMELWGYSTGAAIAGLILNDADYQRRTDNAVFICPVSCVNQSVANIKLGAFNELKYIAHLGKMPSLSWTTESKIPRSEEQKNLRKQIFKALLKRVTQRYDFWKHVRVKDGGNIIVVSGRNDKMSKSYLVNEEFSQYPQTKVLDLIKGYHTTPGVESERILSLIFNLQRNHL